MTISDALISINSYPIPDNAIERFCIDRGLTFSEDYTKEIGVSQEYELATADVYFYLSSHPTITEQEVGINNATAVKQRFFDIAMSIYDKYDDPKFASEIVGYIGDDWNNG